MSLYQDRTRGDWRFECQVNGKRLTGAGYKTKGEARTAREEERKKAKEQPKNVEEQNPGTPTDFLTTSNRYLEYSSKRHALKGFKYKRVVYGRFLNYLRKHGLNETFERITTSQIVDFLSTRPTNRNYNAHLAELSALWTYAIKTLKLIDPRDNPFIGIDAMPHTPKVKALPSEQTVLKMLLAADPVEEKPLLQIILHTWARVDEVLRLRWDDVNLDKQEITFRSRKNRTGEYRPRTIHMNKDLLGVVQALWKRRTQDEWVIFNAMTRTRYTRRPKMMGGIIRRINQTEIKTAKAEGREPRLIRPFGFHTLRHFGATYAKDKLKASTKTIQGILGHTTIRTTDLYLHSVPESEVELMDAMEGRFEEEVKEEDTGAKTANN